MSPHAQENPAHFSQGLSLAASIAEFPVPSPVWGAPGDGENVPGILAMKCCWVWSGGCAGVANSIKGTGSGNT